MFIVSDILPSKNKITFLRFTFYLYLLQGSISICHVAGCGYLI